MGEDALSTKCGRGNVMPFENFVIMSYEGVFNSKDRIIFEPFGGNAEKFHFAVQMLFIYPLNCTLLTLKHERDLIL